MFVLAANYTPYPAALGTVQGTSSSFLYDDILIETDRDRFFRRTNLLFRGPIHWND